MDWFKRYGIPGVYFCGNIVLWCLAFYHGRVIGIKDDHVKIVAGIMTAAFLPIGYFISMLGLLIYHWFPGIGIDRKARIIANVMHQCNSKVEWKHEIETISQIINNIDPEQNKSVDVMKFTLEWMSKRMDMIVINSSLILASVLSPFCLFVFSQFVKLKCHFNMEWYWISLCISSVILLLSLGSWISLKEQLSFIEARVLFKPDIS